MNDFIDKEEKTFELPQFYKSTKAPQPIKALPNTNFYDNHGMGKQIKPTHHVNLIQN